MRFISSHVLKIPNLTNSIFSHLDIHKRNEITKNSLSIVCQNMDRPSIEFVSLSYKHPLESFSVYFISIFSCSITYPHHPPTPQLRNVDMHTHTLIKLFSENLIFGRFSLRTLHEKSRMCNLL